VVRSIAQHSTTNTAQHSGTAQHSKAEVATRLFKSGYPIILQRGYPFFKDFA